MLYPYADPNPRSWALTPGEAPGELTVSQNASLWAALAQAPGVDEVTVLTTDEDVRVELLGEYAGIPVWNALTDTWHPTQMLADMLTMRDHAGKPLDAVTCCYLGDERNNTANPLLVTGALLGTDTRICASAHLQPSAPMRQAAKVLAAESGVRRPADGHRRRHHGRRRRRLPVHRRVAAHGRAGQRMG